MAVKVVIDGDARRVIRELEKLNAALRDQATESKRASAASEEGSNRAIGGLARLRGEFGKVGGAREKAFGSQAKRDLVSFVAGFSAITAAIKLAHDAFMAFEGERSRAADRNRAAERGISSLAQLSGGDPAKMKALTKDSDELYKFAAGKLTRNESAGVLFELESAGINTQNNRALAAGLTEIGLDPLSITRSGGALRAAFGGEETGSLTDIASKAVAAGGLFQVDPGQLLAGAARAGGVGRALGMRDEDVIAMTGVMAEVTGSEAEGGTKSKAFLNSLLKIGGFEGMNAGAAMAKLDAMVTGGVDPNAVRSSEGQIGKLEQQLADVEKRRSRLDEIPAGRSASAQTRRRHQIEDLDEDQARLGAQLTSERASLEGLKKAPNRKLSQAELVKLLGEEGFATYSALSLPENMTKLQAAVTAQDAAQGSDLVVRMVRARRAIPELAADREEGAANAERELATVELGTQKRRDRARFTRSQTRLLEQGDTGAYAANEVLPESVQDTAAGNLLGQDVISVLGAIYDELRNLGGEAKASRAGDMSPKDEGL